MSTKPRTPEHFPRMKHRAAGRIAKQARQHRETTNIFRTLSAFSEMAGQAMNTLADRLGTFIEGIRQIFQVPGKQSDYVLSPPPLIPSRTFTLTEAAPNRVASFMPGGKR
ncbi:hypothetical protein [Arthrobacter sp. Z1-15]